MNLHNVEIDVNKQAQLRPATEFIIKHSCPGIVVSPDLVTNATVARALARGRFRIIAQIDWPKGNQFMVDKFRGVPSDSLNCDGFEVLLTNNRGPADIIREVVFLSSFFHEHFAPTVELRMVFGWFAPNRDETMFKYICDALTKIPTPRLVRTTYLTKLTSADGSAQSHNKCIDFIATNRRAPTKISGNVNAKVYAECTRAERFGCTLEQAQELAAALAAPQP